MSVIRHDDQSTLTTSRTARALEQLVLQAPRVQAVLNLTPRPSHIGLPDICCDLIWTRDRWEVTGPSRFGSPTQNPGREITILQLHPLTARTWLKTPLDQLADRTVALADIDTRLARVLDDVRAEGKLTTLVERRKSDLSFSTNARLVHTASALAKGSAVHQIAGDLGLSERQFERIVARELGVAPKLYSRIVRFRRAALAVRRGSRIAQAAASAGYADQAHFARETKALTGFSLTALMPNVGNVQDMVAGSM